MGMPAWEEEGNRNSVPEEDEITDSDESIICIKSTDASKDGHLVIDESKANTNNTDEDNAKATDATDVTEDA